VLSRDLLGGTEENNETSISITGSQMGFELSSPQSLVWNDTCTVNLIIFVVLPVYFNKLQFFSTRCTAKFVGPYAREA
jgi:hypothetical protein